MKILIIIPHASTGGQPQVALKRVEALVNNHEVYLIEYREIAWTYVVQRNKIKNLLGDRFISLGWIDKEDIRDKFQEIVEGINPDLIHMEEIPEKFIFGMREEHSDWLYRKDRPYKIIETTHTSTFNIVNKKYFPDKFVFVSEYSKKEYSVFDVPSVVIEYPVEKLQRNKGLAIKKLNLNPNHFHILNVGLFTRDKNQGYLFEIAKRLQDYRIDFHFVGNQAENFKDYWGPLMDQKLDNCFIHGERDDVDLFYQAADLLVHPSILELNPLAIKEATSYDLPVYLFNLSTYGDMYSTYKNIKYLTKNIENDTQLIIDNFNLKRKDDNSSFEGSLIDEYEKCLNLEKSENNNQQGELYEYDISFIDGARIEIQGAKKTEFDIDIINSRTNNLIYSTTLSTNTWCVTTKKYYEEYKINIKHKGEILISHNFNLRKQRVMVQIDSKSIGDTLAWFPYIEEFRKKHDCEMYCSTFWNKWFINEYPEINFLEPGYTVENIYAKYLIGWFQPLDLNRNPIDYKKIPLQKTASDILGLDYKEIIPRVEVPDEPRPIPEKYVCIAQFSTANAKHWHYPCKDSNKGWQILVDWLNAQGYKVMVISKQTTKLKNVIDHTGEYPIEQRMNEIKWCEFFIGVGSGLSWLAWALRKKVVMISGFSDPICEFQTNNINVHNYTVCNGCFNIHEFDRSNWNWCPEHEDTNRHFECTINITPKMVTDRIVSSKLISNVVPFDFEQYNVPIVIDKDLINFSYNKEENKIILGYKGEKTPELNIAIKNFHTKKIFHIMSDVNLSKEFVIWAMPGDIIHEKTNKIIISFYEKTELLDMEFDI